MVILTIVNANVYQRVLPIRNLKLGDVSIIGLIGFTALYHIAHPFFLTIYD